MGRRRGSQRGSRLLGPEALTAKNPGGVYEGACTLRADGSAPCGDEAACRFINVTHYTCICPHDSSTPTADLRCPNRATVPLVPRPILNVIPPGTSNVSSNNTASLQHYPTAMNLEPGEVLLAGLAAFCLLIAVFSAVCCRRQSRLSQCCFRSNKLADKTNGTPLNLSKGLLTTDRYAPNPQYSPCSTSELGPALCVPLLSRDHVSFFQEIGEGCFGKVYKGELKTETNIETVAIKVLKESATKEAEEDFMREVEIMSAFKHVNILSLIGVALRESGKNPWMVFEFMSHGDLTEVLRSNSRTLWSVSNSLPRLNKESLLNIALQITNGMSYLATQRFVHRDLACRNCLVGEGLCVKIADFGMSRDIYTCDYYKIGGSRLLPVRWMSPESVMYGRFTLESDVWSFGVVLWEIYSLGKQPYFGHSNEEVVRLILQGIMLIPPEDCPPFICEVMRTCWKTEPRDRTTFSEIQDVLRKASASLQTTLPRPPAFPVTPMTTVEVLDAENYLKPLQTKPKEYLQTLPD